MKKNTLPALLAATCTLTGVLCMAVRQWLLTSGTDKKGLLLASHPGAVISWLLAALVLLTLAAVTVWYKPRCQFHTSPLSDLGNVLQAAALAVLLGRLFRAGSTVAVIAAVAAVIALLCCIAKLLKVKISSPLLRFPLVIFYLLFLVCCYQHWSSQPQLQLYGFQLLALVCLTLSAYHRAALAANRGSSKLYFFTANAGIFLALGAVPGAENPLFFLLMAAATLLDGCAPETDREAA